MAINVTVISKDEIKQDVTIYPDTVFGNKTDFNISDNSIRESKEGSPTIDFGNALYLDK